MTEVPLFLTSLICKHIHLRPHFRAQTRSKQPSTKHPSTGKTVTSFTAISESSASNQCVLCGMERHPL